MAPAMRAQPPLEVLIVEDDPGDVRIIQEALKGVSPRLRFAVCNDGQDAVDLLRRTGRHASAARPHIVFLDLNMPRRNGFETLAEMKSDPELATIPVVVVTTSESPRDTQAAYAAGCNAVVTKPLDLDQYLEALALTGRFWTTVARLPTA